MPEPISNLCAKIPLALHQKIRTYQEASGKTLSEYMTWLITSFYEMEGKTPINTDTRTVAFQIPAELFQQFSGMAIQAAGHVPLHKSVFLPLPVCVYDFLDIRIDQRFPDHFRLGAVQLFGQGTEKIIFFLVHPDVQIPQCHLRRLLPILAAGSVWLFCGNFRCASL